MPELINLPMNGRELEFFESFEGLEIPEEPGPVITFSSGGGFGFGIDIVNTYNFNWNNKHFDWTFKMPDTKLVREADGSVIFVGLPYSFKLGNRTRRTRDRASVIGAVELDRNQFAPGVKYSVKVKVFARVRTGNFSEAPVSFGLTFPASRKLREKRKKFFPAKVCSIKIYAHDDSSMTPLSVETFRESSDSKEITDVREELSISSSEIFPRSLRIEFSFEGSEIFFDKVTIQKLEA
jgi:hypothetical protein